MQVQTIDTVSEPATGSIDSPLFAADSTRGFPWTSNPPTLRQRLIVAFVIAAIAALVHYVRSAESGGLSDFSVLWFGAKALLAGGNPYDLIGPGRTIGFPSALYYPAPAVVAALPFTLLSFHWAGTVFVFICSALLAFGATADGWHRLPIFPSVAFLTSAQLGQWSIIMTAAVFIPALAAFSIAKPQAAFPVLASSVSRTPWVAAVVGSIVLLVASFVMLPHWPADWWNTLRSTDYFSAPIATLPGVAISLVLLRWRRPEAWLIVAAAATPQTWYPYNGLILLAVAITYREACFLSLVSSAGWLAAYFFLVGEWRSDETRYALQNVLIALGYLPAVLVVLRRPNEGVLPWWLNQAIKSTKRVARS